MYIIHEKYDELFRLPIDMETLDTNTMGLPDLKQEVLELFARQLAQHLQALENSRGHKEWYEAAHALKGCASAVGALKIVYLASQFEKLVLAPRGEKRQHVLEPLYTAAEQTREYIRNLSF